MQILVDSNVLFSALLKEGNERQLIEAVILEGHTLVITDLIAEELRRNIKAKYPAAIKEDALQQLAKILQAGFLKQKNHAEYKDNIKAALRLIVKKDAPILAAGLQPEIDVIATSDSHFLKNKKLNYLRRKKILSPRECLAKLEL